MLKHRGARTRPGEYFGPFASVGAVNRTITALQRAFLVRSCTDGFFESRTRPCLLYQISRCSAPCTSEIDFPGLYRTCAGSEGFPLRQEPRGEAAAGAAKWSGRPQTMGSSALRSIATASRRCPRSQSQQGINPRTVEEADVFAIHQEGGYSCVEVFFFRTGQNWGNRAYFPRAERSLHARRGAGAFLAQFYDDKPPPRSCWSRTARGWRAARRCVVDQGRASRSRCRARSAVKRKNWSITR